MAPPVGTGDATFQQAQGTPSTTRDGPPAPPERLRAGTLRELPPGVPVLHVTLVGEYHWALQRTQADPTRGISKDPAFLRAQYDHFATQLPLLDANLVLDVGTWTPDELVDAMVRVFERRKSG